MALRGGQRLDSALVARGYFPSRARARAAIDAGLVTIGGARATKPAMTVRDGDDIRVAGDVHAYVSRGGVKLAAALDHFRIDPAGKVCLDLGASTGGFTDVLIRRGAARVYAVDVGSGQLHRAVQSHPRVISLESKHAKDLARDCVRDPIALLVCDVSFISLTKALPAPLALCAPEAELVALVKPQFELGPARIGKGGVAMATEDELVSLIADLCRWLGERGWTANGAIESPIRGGDGNREFLLAAAR
jgi:23S rRNA (cytidine1920-2'-O)/16S rRNA (cytidine1409-2'-O)-methyltransferase